VQGGLFLKVLDFMLLIIKSRINPEAALRIMLALNPGVRDARLTSKEIRF